jgi:hypothetical protein
MYVVHNGQAVSNLQSQIDCIEQTINALYNDST